MKIILYTYDLTKIGGIETSFYNFAQYLKQLNYEVAVRYTICSPLQLERFQKAGIDIKKEYAEVCDILFIGSAWRQPQMITAKLVVQQIHADYNDKVWKGAGGGIQMIKTAYKLADIYAPVSQSSAEFVKKVVNKKVIVMNNLAPVKTKTNKISHKGLIFAAFTRMTSEKGLDNYIALRQRILELGIEAEFRVYTNGQAPEGWELFEPVPDIKTEFGDIDFVCSLADTESFGYTIAEANSAGIPCIIKRCSSTSEFFSDKDNLIVDSIPNLTAKDLCRTIKSYTLREQTEQNIKQALEMIIFESKQKCIIRTIKHFRDIEQNKMRVAGSIFSVNNQRAKELLANENKIVERL